MSKDGGTYAEPRSVFAPRAHPSPCAVSVTMGVEGLFPFHRVCSHNMRSPAEKLPNRL